MKRAKNYLLIILLTVACFIPQIAAADTGVERWTFGSWQAEHMLSWGAKNLVVDFGVNGLWNFDGSWIRLSLWNPEKLAVWGKQNLAVDFGPHGLWNYDGRSWTRLALGTL